MSASAALVSRGSRRLLRRKGQQRPKACCRVLRGGNGRGEDAHPRRGASDRDQHREAAGVVTEGIEPGDTNDTRSSARDIPTIPVRHVRGKLKSAEQNYLQRTLDGVEP